MHVEVPIGNGQEYNKKEPLYFLSGNSRLLVEFNQNSVIKFSTVTIPSAYCSSGISAIVDVYSQDLFMKGEANNQDLCVFYATSEAKRKNDITSNNLQGNTRLTDSKLLCSNKESTKMHLIPSPAMEK